MNEVLNARERRILFLGLGLMLGGMGLFFLGWIATAVGIAGAAAGLTSGGAVGGFPVALPFTFACAFSGLPMAAIGSFLLTGLLFYVGITRFLPKLEAGADEPATASTPLTCPHCEAVNDVDARFCKSCGSDLADAPDAETSQID